MACSTTASVPVFAVARRTCGRLPPSPPSLYWRGPVVPHLRGMLGGIRCASVESAADLKGDVVRVIGGEGTNYGQLSREAAMQLATDTAQTLELVSQAGPVPVYKMLTAEQVQGKKSLEREKEVKAREAKRKGKQLFNSQSSITKVKEVQLGVHIQQADYSMKLNRAIKFLQKGFAVKFHIKHKRGHGKFEVGNHTELMKTVTNDLHGIGIPDSRIATKGIMSTQFFIPNPAAPTSAADPSVDGEKADEE